MAKTLTAAVRRLKQVDPGLSDRELLERHAAGDPDAFAALVRRHGKTVLAACRPVLTDPADLDDAFQATFVVLLKKAKSMAWQPNLSSWLYAVAHRIAVHARSNQARRMVREAEASRRKAAASPDLSWRDAVAVLHEELDQLPERYRRVLLLCYLDGQSRDEAAANLGLKPGAVKGRLERGRALLATRLKRRGVALSAGLLAVLAGNSTAAGGPSAALIDLTVQAGGGILRPAVAALVNGAFPVTTTLKRALLPAVLVLGLVAAGFDPGASHPAVGADEKPAQKTEKPATVSLAVRVVDEDGRPVSGAKVWVCQSGQAISPKLPAPRHAATSDPDGRCILSGRPNEDPLSWSVIAATKDGYGPGFVSPAEPNSGSRTLTLVKDDVPITGVVLNLQGQPVAGASVQPLALHRSDAANLDGWEKAARRSTKEAVGGFRTFFPHSVRLKDGPLDGIAAAVKTDKDGRFTLRGLGRDRLVTLRVSGPGIATQEIEVVTRATTTIRTLQDKLDSHYSPKTYFGAKFDLAVEPAQPFVGIVTDKETGKPVPNVVIRSRASWDESLQAVTDANGKYRLDGLRTGEQDLIAVPPIDTPYHLREFRAGRPANESPVTADMELLRGVWVSGTVTDKATGKPVAASVSYRPSSDAADLVPGYLPRGMHDLSWYTTDKDGRFRVLALPGEGFVFVRAYQNYLTADQLDWQGDLTKTEPRSYADSAPVEIASNWNAIGGITVGETPKEYAFTVNPGVSMKARITDPDGKPLAGARVTQRTNFSPFEVGTLDTADAVFERVNPKRPRPVLILHPDKHLGAVFRTTLAETGPADIRLKPTGTATGRLLTEDGKPMANTPVEVLYTLSDDGGWRVTDLFPQVTTDADGKFNLPNLIEGVRYELRWPRPAPKKASGYHSFTVTSGEEKKLGDLSGER